MTILALDTTGEFGSIALRRGGATLKEIQLHSPDGFAHVIFPETQRLLNESHCTLRDIDCFAAASGPGSFTGVRVGLTAIKGLAEAMNKPVAAVSNLRALASIGTGARRIPVIDARRGEVYTAVYDDALRVVFPETVIKFPQWLDVLAGHGSHSYEFITFSGSPFRLAAAGTPFEHMQWTEAPRSLAAAIALCADLDCASGTLLSPIEVDANYIRSSDAELFWRDR